MDTAMRPPAPPSVLLPAAPPFACNHPDPSKLSHEIQIDPPDPDSSAFALIVALLSSRIEFQ